MSVVYVVEDGPAVRGLPPAPSPGSRLASRLDPIRLATAEEIAAAGFPPAA